MVVEDCEGSADGFAWLDMATPQRETGKKTAQAQRSRAQSWCFRTTSHVRGTTLMFKQRKVRPQPRQRQVENDEPEEGTRDGENGQEEPQIGYVSENQSCVSLTI